MSSENETKYMNKQSEACAKVLNHWEYFRDQGWVMYDYISLIMTDLKFQHNTCVLFHFYVSLNYW